MSFFRNIGQQIRGTLANWVLTGNLSGLGTVSSRLTLPGINRPAEHVLGVYACLRARVAAIQQAKLRIADDQGNFAMGGDLFDLLERPALDFDLVHWIGTIESYLTLYDMAFIAMVSESGRNPDELIPLSPRFMRAVLGVHKPTGTARALGWVYDDPHTGQSVTFRPDELIVVPGINPHAPCRALAPTDAAMRTMQADYAARESNLGLFLNGASPSVVLQTDQALTTTQADEIMARWTAKNSGFQNAHKPAILYNGLKAAKLGLSPQEMQYLEGLRFTTSELLMAFRVMPAMVGILSGETGLSQGTSTQEQKVAWWEDVGLPELSRIASALNHGLVSRFQWQATMRKGSRMDLLARNRAVSRAEMSGRGFACYFDDNQIPALVKHRLAKIETMKSVMAFGYAPDDVNAYLDLGLPPHPTNVGMIPLGVQAVGDLALAPASAPESQPVRGMHDALAGLGRALATRCACGGTHEARGKAASLHKQFRGLVAKHTKGGARKMSRYFMEQRARVLARLERVRAVAGAEVRANADDMLRQIFPSPVENAELTRRMLGAWTEALTDGWDLANEQAGLTDHPFQLDDPNIRKALDRRTVQGTKINDTTADDLRQILADGIDAGENNAQIGDRIAEYYQSQIGETAARPQTAARTQMAGIVNDGQMAAARDAGDLKKIWVHGAPADPRESHAAAEREYAAGIPLDEPFMIEGVPMDAPGDATAPVEQTANCTCMVIFTGA